MTSSISGIASSMGQMRMHRPDPTQMANKLFSKLDTKNQGHIEKSDLQSAFQQVSGSDSGNSSNVDDIFKQLDGDSDGKITKDEMTSGLQKLAEELDSQFNSMRMNGFGGQQGMQGMPPPPPKDDAGFTKDELSSQLQEIGSTDSKRSQLMSNIVDNFDAADADGDGKVTFKEAKAYEKSTSNSSSSSDGSAGTASTGESSEAQVMKKIMQLMHAYADPGNDNGQSNLASLLSISA